MFQLGKSEKAFEEAKTLYARWRKQSGSFLSQREF